MIKSFKCRKTKLLSEKGECDKNFRAFRSAAERRLRRLEAAVELYDLRQPPSNHFEALGGDRKGQYSIRINDKWRICFTWGESGAEDVEIVNYH